MANFKVFHINTWGGIGGAFPRRPCPQEQPAPHQAPH